MFDSGFGGLTILKEMVRLSPRREYLYLGDNLRAPYGNRTQKKIFELTIFGVEWLFSQGAEIVILACNTASANALRKIQKEVLPRKYPEKKVLGIIIPTMEEVKNFTTSGHIGVLATKATVASRAFEKELRKQNIALKRKIQMSSQSGGKLTELIEREGSGKLLEAEIKKVLEGLILKDKLIDTVILGCTHYPLIKEQIKKILPKNISLIGQGEIIAKKLEEYVSRHAEIGKKLSTQPAICFHTTSQSQQVKKMMAQFYGKKILVKTANLK